MVLAADYLNGQSFLREIALNVIVPRIDQFKGDHLDLRRAWSLEPIEFNTELIGDEEWVDDPMKYLSESSFLFSYFSLEIILEMLKKIKCFNQRYHFKLSFGGEHRYFKSITDMMNELLRQGTR